jgi:hypothetical protein
LLPAPWAGLVTNEKLALRQYFRQLPRQEMQVEAGSYKTPKPGASSDLTELTGMHSA